MLMDTPKISVIIPNYNHADYLIARVDSVLNQTYKNLEVILMDDCSSDNSRDIIKKYVAQDNRVHQVFNRKNSGSTFKQWNKGISFATGEYVWIAESDDVSDLTFLEKMVAKMEAYPSVGLAYCQSWRIDENGEKYGTLAADLANFDAMLWTHDFVMSGKELARRFMSYGNIIANASSVLMRRSTLDTVEAADETMRLAGDWVFWIRFLMVTDVVFMADPLNYFRFHQRNVRSRTESDGTLLLEVARAMKVLTVVVTPEPIMYRKAINQMLERWLHGLVYYDMTLARHQQFLRLMQEIEPTFKRQAIRKFIHFLMRNRFSGVKMLIGDKLLGRANKIKI